MREQFFDYRIAEMFGGGKVWQIWRIDYALPNFNWPNFTSKWYLVAEIYPFAKLFLTNGLNLSYQFTKY